MTDILDDLAEADLALREAKATLERRIREQTESELSKLKIKRDLLAYQAKEAGKPISQIARKGMHTSATISAYQAIARGAEYAPKPASEEAVLAKEVQPGPDGTIRYTPPQEALTALLPMLGVDADDFAATKELHYADFLVEPSSDAVWPQTEAYTDEHGRHPVVALVMGEDPTHRKRILEGAA